MSVSYIGAEINSNALMCRFSQFQRRTGKKEVNIKIHNNKRLTTFMLTAINKTFSHVMFFTATTVPLTLFLTSGLKFYPMFCSANISKNFQNTNSEINFLSY